MFLNLFIVALGLVSLMMAGLCIRILFEKDGRAPSTSCHAADNDTADGFSCGCGGSCYKGIE
jgi:hypothetical protein